MELCRGCRGNWSRDSMGWGGVGWDGLGWRWGLLRGRMREVSVERRLGWFAREHGSVAIRDRGALWARIWDDARPSALLLRRKSFRRSRMPRTQIGAGCANCRPNPSLERRCRNSDRRSPPTSGRSRATPRSAFTGPLSFPPSTFPRFGGNRCFEGHEELGCGGAGRGRVIETARASLPHAGWPHAVPLSSHSPRSRAHTSCYVRHLREVRSIRACWQAHCH